MAEGLAGEIVGAGGGALSAPFVALQRWEGLGEVGDVWRVAAAALAFEGELLLWAEC